MENADESPSEACTAAVIQLPTQTIPFSFSPADACRSALWADAQIKWRALFEQSELVRPSIFLSVRLI